MLWHCKGEILSAKLMLNNSADSVKYSIKEVFIPMRDENFCLSGTLTIPDIIVTGQKQKVVVLVSPPQAEGNYIFFSDLSQYLSRKGIAVLNFKNRSYSPSYTSMHTQAEDVRCVIDFLRNLEKFRGAQLGLIGHSEGGSTCVIVGSQNQDVDFLVLLSTLGISGRDFTMDRVRIRNSIYNNFPGIEGDTATANEMEKNILSSFSTYINIVNQENDINIIKQRVMNEQLKPEWIKSRPKASFDEYCEALLRSELYSNRVLSVIKYDPLDYLPKIQVPVLAISGLKDYIINAENNLSGLKKGLDMGKNHQVLTVSIDSMNHDYEIWTGKEMDYNPGGGRERKHGTRCEEAWQIINSWIEKR